MNCNIYSEKTIDVLELSGEVDLQFSPELREKILEQLGKKKGLLIDLAGVSYIDSSGIASLVEGLQVARNNDLPYGLLRISEAASQVLSLTRLDKVFSLYGSLDEFKSRAEA